MARRKTAILKAADLVVRKSSKLDLAMVFRAIFFVLFIAYPSVSLKVGPPATLYKA